MPRSVRRRVFRDRLDWGKPVGRPCAANSRSQKARAKKPRSSLRGSRSTTYAPPREVPSKIIGQEAVCFCESRFARVVCRVMARLECRFCKTPLADTVVDLGMSPLCETFLPADQLDKMEPFYPLHVWVCRKCLLVQISEYVRVEEIFTEYAYFSSYSTAWLKHAEGYVSTISQRLSLDKKSFVIELASNDG